MVVVEEHHPGHQVVVVEHHGGPQSYTDKYDQSGYPPGQNGSPGFSQDYGQPLPNYGAPPG